MIILLGLVTVFGSILLGYTMHHGNLAVLVQVSEFVIIGGAAIGSLVVANPLTVIKGRARQVVGLLKANPYNEQSYSELLQALFELFQTARRDGLIGVERHIENPASSDLFIKYPMFRSQSHAVAFLTDTLKVLLAGAMEEHRLSEILEMDMERQHEEAMAALVGTMLGILLSYGLVSPIAQAGAAAWRSWVSR